MSLADGRFDLLETMAFDPHEGIRLLELHLARMKVSADALGFAFDRHDVRNELQAATFRLRDRSRVRLLVSRGGALFPHLYADLPMSAVAGKVILRLDEGGQHLFPAGF